MRILHLTDTHLRADRGFHYDLVDTTGLLEKAIAQAGQGDPCDAIVVSGDVSDDGSVQSYQEAARIVGGLAEKWSVPLIVAAGNHDVRGPLRQVFNIAGQEPEPINYVTQTPSHRFIVADTSVPKAGWGFLGESMAWIGRQLDSDLPSVLVLHHPPATPPTVLHGALRLADAPQLALLLAQAKNRPVAVLSGHYHLPMRASVSAVPVVVGAALANVTSQTHGPDWESATRGSAYTVVSVPDTQDSGVLDAGVLVCAETHWVEPPSDDELFAYDPQQVGQIIGHAGRPDFCFGAKQHWLGAGSELISGCQ